ncbi:Uncharacterized protein TPAR_02540 [Tolypocladium paradoxum]|uniref:C3H1-type domain-containing protein n=1 Tax=Tolypocladium paradoxum TaxID=94208 RepID=A0A2S4L4A6_9HYPO|nr:Uncharacterized protein TPAR_02540 [Tolypocladium paradoxum]
MQPWSTQGQNGVDGHDQWQTGFVYPSQNGQYDPNQQAWSQPMTGQATNYPQVSHDAHAGAATDFHFDSAHQDAGAFLEEQHLTASQPSQAAFHGGHGSMPLNQHQQFPPGQDILDASFSNIHPNLFAQQQQPQQGKMDLGGGNGGMNHMGLAQAQNHPHTHPQAYGQHAYSFSPQGGQAFSPQAPQYSQPQLMPRPSPSRQQSHTPVQQHFESNDGHVGFSQSPAFARPPQQSPVPQQQQPSFSAAGQAFAPPGNGQGAHYQSGSYAHLAYTQYQEAQPQPHLQQAHFQQSGFAPPQPLPYQQSGPGPVGQVPTSQQLQQQQQQVAGRSTSQPTPPPATGNFQPAPPQQPAAESDSGTGYESLTKKRKRATKSVPDVSTGEPLAPAIVDLTVESAAKKAEEIDALEAPAPSAEETRFMAESGKRVKAAQGKAPPANAVPFLAYDASVKLPAPKSYDKLSPLVAVPPRSGKSVVAGLGYGLPCEIQGNFTNQYKPSFDKAGLDERKAEAKNLLDEYDRSMKALGKRQPKYTEYPNAFKEQLKADEASKNKAGKKAKKDLEHERNKPIRAATRPTDPAAAAAWDIIGIVHLEKAIARTSAMIAGRVQQAGEFLINLRTEANRAKLALDQATKDNVPEAEVANLKIEADQKREALYKALDATVEHADDSVLDNLGGHQKLVLSLINILISCIKSADFSGKLPKIVLELFTHLTMTDKIVETPNFDTVRKRLEDKGDDDVKDLTREITLKIKKFKRANEPETATGYKGTSAASRAKAGTKPAAAESSAKRSRDDDSDTRIVKKIAVEPGSSLLSKKLGQPKGQPLSGAKTAGPKSILPGKSRPVAKPVSKPEPPVAADSPGASADEKSKAELRRPIARPESKTAAAKKEAKPVAPKTVVTSSSSAVSSISSLLDSINAKKPDAAVAPASKEGKRSQTPETAEQRAKRLHKEARRKLRVSWKPEGELVQIKVFEKDDEEDEGRDVNMIRDAADDRSEGMVLKRRADVGVEDDDDDLPYHPWVTPVATDFSHLPESIRKKSYVTRGGHVAFSTEEQKRMAEREQRELMAIYTDPADIPPTPKSPPPETSVARTVTKLGYLPKEDSRFQEIQLRWAEEQQMGLDQALVAALKRFDARDSLSTRLDSILGRITQQGPGGSTAAAKTSPASSAVASGAATQATNSNVPFIVGPPVEAPVLEWLRWDRMKSWRDPDPVHVDTARVHQYADPDVQMSGTAVEAAATNLAGKPHPAVSPPEWLAKDEERIREWWLGFNKESAARQRKEEEERARAEAEANALRAAGQGSGNAQDWSAYYAQQQQAYAPYMALLQHVNGGQQQQPPAAAVAQSQQSQIPDSQLQSILAAINQPSQQQPAHAQHSNTGGYEPSYQAFSQGQEASTCPGDRDWERGESQHSRGEHKDAKDGRKKKGSLPPHKPVNKALIGTKPCTFWQQGKCARGDKCTFRHD